MGTGVVAQRIEAVWSLDPAARALQFEGEWLTWGQWRAAAQAIDRALTQAGIPQGQPVGVLLRNRPGHEAALLAMLTTDRCLVSINALQPDAKLAKELESLALPALVGDVEDWAREPILAAAKAAGSVVVAVPKTASGQIVCRHSPKPNLREPSNRDAIEILTSGTTGAPKRIRLSRATLDDAILDGIVPRPGASKTDPPVLQRSASILFAPLVHVSGIFGTLLAVYDARPLVLLEKFAVDRWIAAVREHKPKFSGLPPTTLRMVLDANVAKDDLASLIAVRSGTAPLPAETQKAFQDRYGIPVLVQYGATEWVGGLAGWTLEEHRKYGAAKLGSVGRPRGDVRMRVVDPASGAEVPVGEVGLLEVFAAGRLGKEASWSRTTDMALIDADGFIYITGRADDAIIRGGFKIDANAVAAVLRKHPAVQDASVVGIDEPRLGQVPVAAVERRAGLPAPSAAELEAMCRDELLAYQVPVRFVVTDALPRTPSLKVSRPGVKALFET
jgi:acyl-CoA synthetase (AMP-forming)/AMP-acid ligase II